MQDTAPSGSRPPAASASWQLAALCLAAFLSALNFFATSPFYPAIADDLDTSVPLLGQAVTLMLVISAVLGLVAGPLADHYGYRRLLVLGIGAIGVNMFGTALATAYPTLLALSIVGALGDALVFGLTLALAGTLFDGTLRRRAISWTIASLSAGAIVGVPILTLIGDASSWRVAIATVGVSSVAIAGMVLAVMPPDRRATTRTDIRTLFRAYQPLRGHGETARLFGVTVFRAVWFLGAFTYLGAYLDEQQGLSTSEVGFAYMLGGGGAIVGSILAGSRWVNHGAAVIAATNLGGGILLGVFLWVASPVVALGVLPVIAGLAAVGGVSVTSLLSTTSPAQAGTTMALNASLLNAGAAIGAAVGGLLIALGGYGALGIGFPAFAVTAATLALWPRRPVVSDLSSG